MNMVDLKDDRQSRHAGGKGQLRLCLAASGGGHIRQLLDLEEAWSPYHYVFVSEDTALSRSIVQKHPVHFLPHFAIGQIRRDGLLRAVWSGLKNLWRSALLAVKLRPDVVISTGAGSVFFFMIWCRLLGSKFVLIETFARFDKPSTFARAAAIFANDIIVQSDALTKTFPTAAVFDPLKILDQPRPNKKRLLFATVGVTFPFDRLVEMVAKLKQDGEIFEDVVFQTGIGGLTPPGLQSFETLSYDQVKSYLREADIVVCHGGTGSVITALREGCRTIVVPRRLEKGEHYDNHQREITSAFAARGLITPANSTEELAVALKTARSLEPICATTDPVALVKHLKSRLGEIAVPHRQHQSE
jgi:UDP-N-acetylglucosamine--N-acetylmuramyl-(pentapeptide) pyrophosphoryl-undecaprenol N-acetylglucosamine transferase